MIGGDSVRPTDSSNGAIFYKTCHRRGQDEDYAVTGSSLQYFLGITINIMLSFFSTRKVLQSAISIKKCLLGIF